MTIRIVVVDYGGVLTNPLVETFTEFATLVGLGVEELFGAFAAATQRYGQTPMADLETGAITEHQMVLRILAELPRGHGGALDGRPFGELWFRGRRPNEPFVSFLRTLKGEGYELAMLTNNVREWEPRWRAQLPVDELFRLVVDSHKEGVRKPSPEIYQILLSRLGAEPAECLFVDDTEENVEAARALGIPSVLFTDTDSGVHEIRLALKSDGGTAR
ncbi:HAD family phosphatase [Streptomyces sp. NPDC093544]|uniref:HAD family hydrolase n=1 Tax=Streptomyces sp. NPDC093544 TaxID=3155200 RepID=UPI00342503C4